MKPVCIHEHAQITLYEESSCRYLLSRGKVVGKNEDLEPQPMHKATVSCFQCGLNQTYQDWQEAPEPIRSYCESLFQQEYN